MDNTKEHSLGMKAFAVLGFLALIIFFVWVAIQVVSLLPSAFSSLASIADGLQTTKSPEEIIVTTASTVVSNNETFVINWSDTKAKGTYTFSYKCADGVSIDVRYPSNSITTVPCGDVLSLGNSILSLNMMAHSERYRFTDVVYTISFIPQGETAPTISKDSVITIINASIPQSGSGEIIDKDDEKEPAKPVDKPATSTTPTKPVATGTTTIYTPIYTIPQSNPNGNVDLSTRFLSIGSYNNYGTYIGNNIITNNRRGAVQFEVKNIGTKTSGNWTFEITLPSGAHYKSNAQAPLKPNERSVLTISFDNVGSAGTKLVDVRVSVSADSNTNNNRFTKYVNVTN